LALILGIAGLIVFCYLNRNSEARRSILEITKQVDIAREESHVVDRDEIYPRPTVASASTQVEPQEQFKEIRPISVQPIGSFLYSGDFFEESPPPSEPIPQPKEERPVSSHKDDLSPPHSPDMILYSDMEDISEEDKFVYLCEVQ